eukprot:11155013-Lingulodinium_polyedra.AAC.1
MRPGACREATGRRAARLTSTRTAGRLYRWVASTTRATWGPCCPSAVQAAWATATAAAGPPPS